VLVSFPTRRSSDLGRVAVVVLNFNFAQFTQEQCQGNNTITDMLLRDIGFCQYKAALPVIPCNGIRNSLDHAKGDAALAALLANQKYQTLYFQRPDMPSFRFFLYLGDQI